MDLVGEIIRLYKGKDCLVRQEKALKAQIDDLQQDLKRIQEDLRVASSVSFIYKGVPIGGFGCGWCSRIPTVHGKYRSGGIYLNAHNNTTWGVKIHTGIGFHDEVFLGAGYPSQEAAKHIVLEFIVSGKVLPDSERKY